MRWDPAATFAEPKGLWRPGAKPSGPSREADRELTPLESAIAALVLEDMPAIAIAGAVGLASVAQVEASMDAIQRKVGARTRWGLALRLRELLERGAVKAARSSMTPNDSLSRPQRPAQE